jgi:thiamine biosynthesis lipoprotein ApbE
MFYFHHDHVIGTSLDVWVVVSDEHSADVAEQAILTEIERLRKIFSTFDANSEISVLNRTSGPVPASADMLNVLRLYEVFQQRSHGAFNGQLGDVINTWKAAEKAGAEPDPLVLESLVQQISRPGWSIDEYNDTVTRLTTQPLNLNSIAKGYIIQKATEAARAAAPAMAGLLLNLGGDMFAWGMDDTGKSGWRIGVQDPFHPEDNAVPIAILALRDRAVATSGGYERYYQINGKRYSHIFDPRTGRPARGVASATVIAADNATANALATTLCVLSPEEGLRLIAATAGSECLLVTDAGQELRSPGLAAFELASPRHVLRQDKKADPPKNGLAWPLEYQVSIAITLPAIEGAGKRYRRPYVAVWVEIAEAKPVRTIAVWGNSSRYLKDLSSWWTAARNDVESVSAITRATRAPGKYTLAWDGLDDKAKALPQGTYTIRVEVHREHGKHTIQAGKIECRADAASVTLEKNAEIDATVIDYGKKK